MRSNSTLAAGLDSGPVSLEPYRSRDFFEFERNRVFARAWLVMGRVVDLPAVGDSIVKEVEICQASILLTHGVGGVTRAFHNVCSDRGNQVVWDESGSRKTMFRCPYHNVERTQKGVAARAKNFMNLQDNEVLIRRMIDLLDKFGGSASLEEALEACA